MSKLKLVTLNWLLLAFAMFSGDVIAAEPAQVVVRFGTDVVPILTKLGCNGGGCHGKATGQNGFKLSLFGFEPEVDYDALVTDARGRRLNHSAPGSQLAVAQGDVAHAARRRSAAG